jgi:hypothetical protein
MEVTVTSTVSSPQNQSLSSEISSVEPIIASLGAWEHFDVVESRDNACLNEVSEGQSAVDVSPAVSVPPALKRELEVELHSLRSEQKFEIMELPNIARLHELIDELHPLLNEFSIDNFDVLTSSDRKRRILTQQVSYKDGALSPAMMRLKHLIENSKNEVLDIMLSVLSNTEKFGHLSSMVGAVLGSRKGAKSQQVHVDFAKESLDKVVEDGYPWSMVIPVNDYCFLGVRPDNGVEEWLTVRRGQFLIFRGDLYHCGGPHFLNEPQFRLHAYGVTGDIRPPENAILVHPTEMFLKIPLPVVEPPPISERRSRICKKRKT